MGTRVRLAGSNHGNFVDQLLNRLSDPRQAYYAYEAREFLQRKLIGRHVPVQVDFIWPREGKYDECESATLCVRNQGV